ncbi:mitochondrial ribosomal protein S21 isoform X2 [Ptiloglossa arizonensis]|uniref:mitochondrial ribosomal protein S21 isoform X2 n=1 Tax=Ptiloglossa arizonensis TaxID=3350558 RepID=UPI003FA1269D
MFRIHIYATPFSVILLLISLSVWLCICRWGLQYNLKDTEILSCLILYFIIITLLNMLFLGHMQFSCDKSMMKTLK